MLFYIKGQWSPLQLDEFKQWPERRKWAMQLSGRNSFLTTKKGTALDEHAAYTVCLRPNKETSMAGMVWGEGTVWEAIGQKQ